MGASGAGPGLSRCSTRSVSPSVRRRGLILLCHRGRGHRCLEHVQDMFVYAAKILRFGFLLARGENGTSGEGQLIPSAVNRYTDLSRRGSRRIVYTSQSGPHRDDPQVVPHPREKQKCIAKSRIWSNPDFSRDATATSEAAQSAHFYSSTMRGIACGAQMAS